MKNNFFVVLQKPQSKLHNFLIYPINFTAFSQAHIHEKFKQKNKNKNSN